MNKQTIRKIEKDSIRRFMEESKDFLKGRVLDWGCGDMPYKYLVDGTYEPFDKEIGTIKGKYDAIMCNQVIEYIREPILLLKDFCFLLNSGGYLVMTYPTTWEEVDFGDFYRFTENGMNILLAEAGFEIIKSEERARIDFEDYYLALGYGVVAKKISNYGGISN